MQGRSPGNGSFSRWGFCSPNPLPSTKSRTINLRLSATKLALFIGRTGSSICLARGEGASLQLPVRQPARCREHGTYGGQGKAVGCVPPAALLFVESRSFFIEMVTLAGLEPAPPWPQLRKQGRSVPLELQRRHDLHDSLWQRRGVGPCNGIRRWRPQ